MGPTVSDQKRDFRRGPFMKKSRASKLTGLPDFLQPQLATLVNSVPQGDEWLHEIKFDGYRILCRIDGGRISFLTREAQDWTDRFKALAAAVKELQVRQAFLDGEVVALDANGINDFQLLQNSLKQNSSSNLVYYVFDLLHVDGFDLIPTPLLARKERLKTIIASSGSSQSAGALRYSEHWIGEGEALFEKACAMGLEGIISKRKDQPYRSGRSKDWLKIKCVKSQEFVIGGFTDPAGSRAHLGALLLGVHDDDGSLRYAGRVGTGFNSKTLADLRVRLDKLARKSPPFIDPPTGSDARGVHWVNPDLVGEVVFTGWTSDGLLRHPSFKGLREDKPAKKVKREAAVLAPKSASSGSNSSGSGGADVIAGVRLTHPDRILYPEQGITKRELALYYQQIADWIMPHIENRPLTLVRCPEGYKKQCFYQRHTRDSLDGPIHSIPGKEGKATASYLYIDSLSGLIALVQMGVLELHTWGARIERLEQPDRMIFDLDPDSSVSWKKLQDAAQTLRSRLSELGLTTFVKTTGGKGLHLVVPITPKQDWDFVKEFSRSVAQSIVRAAPDRYTATMSKSQRKGKIFIDYLRNARTATAVCAYSPRARSGAPVSMPLRWEELAEDVRSSFTIRNVHDRLAHLRKDPWQNYQAARTTLTKAMLQKL
jgi:bifunctional non-homologous end joining protein LigD